MYEPVDGLDRSGLIDRGVVVSIIDERTVRLDGKSNRIAF